MNLVIQFERKGIYNTISQQEWHLLNINTKFLKNT